MRHSRWMLVLGGVLLGLPLSAGAQPSGDALKKEAVSGVEKLSTLTQQMVDSIFSFSELGFQEVETTRYVTGLLEKNGFRVERGVAGVPTAWVASWSSGSGKPVIAFITDIDCIPRASQKPGVAYHDPIVEGAPGHGEGHNTGMAVNVTAAIALKALMSEHHLSGTLKLYPGVAEEILGVKAHYVRAGLFKDVGIVLGCHVSDDFSTLWGQWGTGLVSVQYFFHGKAAHAAAKPWEGRSALDAVELMDTGWNFRREHLRLQQRSHYVIVNGGEQPNVVPSEAGVWYYFRELDFPHIQELYELGNTMAQAATMMTGTTVNRKIVGSAWPAHFNRSIAQVQQKNIEMVGVPAWSEADQTLARALQKEIGAKVEGLKTKVTPLEPPKELTGGPSDDVGDISWNVPMVYLRYPANIPNLPGHSWENAVAEATPIAHKGSTAGAKVQAMTAIDYLLSPRLVEEAWAYFRDVQTKDVKYTPLIGPDDRPAIEFNREKMEKFAPQLKKTYYDSGKYKTYLEQLGVAYPTVKKTP
jgi:aminobenzoyl-glutamate utilization protein B